MAINYRNYAVLFVDDEPQNLVAFRYAMEDRFTVFTASSGTEGLEILRKEDVAVLLADHRMPGMTGVELCREAHSLRPDTVRIILTAYADLHATIDAINEGKVSRYLLKPWRNDELAEVLSTAIDLVHVQRAVSDMEIRLLRSGQSRAATAVHDELIHELSTPLSALELTVGDATERLNEAQQRLRGGGVTLSQGADLLEESLFILADAQAALDQLSSIVVNTREGRRSDSRGRPSCDVSRVIDTTARILRRELERVARLEIVLEQNPIVPMDASALGQVLLNLLLNAAQALGEGDVEGHTIQVSGRQIQDTAILTVADDGPGIEPEKLANVFTPYFTTKDEGTGLGLSIVRELVHQAGGTVRVRSEPNVQTVFEIQLPAIESASAGVTPKGD